MYYYNLFIIFGLYYFKLITFSYIYKNYLIKYYIYLKFSFVKIINIFIYNNIYSFYIFWCLTCFRLRLARPNRSQATRNSRRSRSWRCPVSGRTKDDDTIRWCVYPARAPPGYFTGRLSVLRLRLMTLGLCQPAFLSWPCATWWETRTYRWSWGPPTPAWPNASLSCDFCLATFGQCLAR